MFFTLIRLKVQSERYNSLILNKIHYNMSKTSKNTATTVEATVAVTKTASRKGMSYAKLSQDQKREIIAGRKNRGDGAVIAAKMGVTTTYVSSVITGRKANPKVVNQMYDMVRGRKAKATA